jgi:hypothetical protein
MQFKILTYLNFFSLFLIIQFSLLNFHCKKPTPPEVDDTPKPGKRDYTWTIDTLAYPGSFQTLMRDIWASSPTNVYVVGHNDQNMGHMFHYNGTKWSTVKLTWSDGGPLPGAIDLSAIYGFGPNDIYAVGERIYDNPTPPPNFLDSSLIIHYDGVKWKEIHINRGRFLVDISGSSISNIWAVGWEKYSIYHYDGFLWQRDSINLNTQPSEFFQIYSISVFSDYELYALANTHVNELAKDIYYFLKFSNGGWVVIDSAVVEPGRVENKWGYSKIWKSPWGTLYSIGAGVFRWNGTGWTKVFDSEITLEGIFGTSEKNIFVVGHFGKVLHFNGNDWYQYPEFLSTGYIFRDVWTDSDEVFLLGISSTEFKTYILHGK